MAPDAPDSDGDAPPPASLSLRLRRALLAPWHYLARLTLLELLNNKIVRDSLWGAVNLRPRSDLHYLPGNLQKHMYDQATATSAAFLSERYPMAAPHRSARALLDTCVRHALTHDPRGLFLEFGVFEGRTVNRIADQIAGSGALVHGFDSFEGLPEDWNATGRKGAFSAKGIQPAVRPNARLHAGWFDQSLPPFLQEHPGPLSFLHIDSDLYSSARTVLTGTRDRIHVGTVILFDEFLNYPGYEAHEFKAFAEFLSETGHTVTCLGFDAGGFAVGFAITT